MAINLSGLLKMLTSEYEESRAKRQTEYETGKGILQSVVEQFAPGYLKGEEQEQLAAMEQGMVSKGLSGTTRPAAMRAKIKADIRDRAAKGRAGAMTNVAQFMAGFQDIYPDPGTLAHLATGGFSGQLQEELAKAPGGPLGPTQYSAGGSGGGMQYSGGVSAGTGAGAAAAVNGGSWSGGGASRTVHFGPPHKADPGYGLGEELNPYSKVVTRGGTGGWTFGYRGGGNI